MEKLKKVVVSKYVKIALKKRKTHNTITPSEMNLEMEDFIPCIYNKCSPNYYGLVFSQKIIKESNEFLKTTPHSMDNGDFYFYDFDLKKTFFGEIKISYKGKNGNYRITNIRDHQKFDFFVLCFVDTEKNFIPRYYIVPKKSVTNSGFFYLTPMNGTKVANMNNEVVPKSTSVKESDCDWYFKKHTLLKGDTFSDLKQFFNKDFIKTHKTKIFSSLNS